MTTRRLTCSLALALLFATTASAQTLPSIDGRIEQLKPGEYLWAPEIAPAGPVTVIVSLAAQKAYAYRNGVAIGVSTVSTGSDGHATPTGVFTVLQKDVDHVSNLYKDAAMPFMQRLTWDGIAASL
jgi:lipoprotein-anchoring transpeptidase ErfK/SrfK